MLYLVRELFPFFFLILYIVEYLYNHRDTVVIINVIHIALEYLFLRVFVYIVYIYFNVVLRNFYNLSIFMKL